MKKILFKIYFIFCFNFYCLINSYVSPYFFDLTNLVDSTFLFSEKAIIALIMTLIIISRQIDLSVASIIAISLVFLVILIRWDFHFFHPVSLIVVCFVVLLMDF